MFNYLILLILHHNNNKGSIIILRNQFTVTTDNERNDGKSQKDGIIDLFESCREGDESSVLSLLGNEADRNYCSPIGLSPLLVASLQGHEILAKILHKNKGNVNLCGLYLVSPLYAPCIERDKFILKVFYMMTLKLIFVLKVVSVLFI